MKRLRVRLIIAFLGVALLAMIPLALVPYYTLTVHRQKVRTEILNSTQEKIEKFIHQAQNVIDREILFKAAEHLRESFEQNERRANLLVQSESRDDAEIQNEMKIMEGIIWEYVERAPSPLNKAFDRNDIRVYPLKQYQGMKDWIENQLFYEEGNTIYVWITRDLFRGSHRDDMELVGGLFAKSRFIQKNPGQSQDTLYIAKNFDFNPIVVDPAPSILEPYLPREAYERLYDFDEDGVYDIVDVSNIEMEEGWPVQARIIPVLNQYKKAAAFIVLSVPILGVWDILVPPMAYGFSLILVVIIIAAVLLARSLGRPIYELADAARSMSEGDFEVRVKETGTEEQRVLRAAFNNMANQIQHQFRQLRQKTSELEISNRELSQTQHFLENILANIRSGVMSVDREGKVNHINQVGVEMLKVEEWQNRPVQAVFGESQILSLIQYGLKQVESIYQQEIPYKVEEGEVLSLQVSIVPLMDNQEMSGLVVTFHDLSAIRLLEEQVRRQDRLAALGRMAAGVAHEIRNPLGIIRGSAQLLHKRFAHEEKEQGLSEFIIEEVNRLSRVLNDFLMFARPPEPNLEEIEVENLLQQVLSYAPDEEMIVMKTHVEERIPSIAADMGLSREAFLNLILNAKEAMPNGGSITLKAFRRSKREVVIEVIDEGEGIHPEMLDQIFDPFYTSKDSGTGLGLSLVHQIISSQGGGVEVESQPKQGSIFRLIFQTWETVLKSQSEQTMV